MPGIVRQALEERLQLKTHVEKRNFPVLALVMAREDRAFGPRLRVASRPCFDLQQWIAAGQPRDQLPEWRRVPPCGGVHDSSLGWTQHSSVTMPAFAEYLRDYVRGWVLTPRDAANTSRLRLRRDSARIWSRSRRRTSSIARGFADATTSSSARSIQPRR